MEIWIATHNHNKIKEMQYLLKSLGAEVHGASELSFFSPPEETEDSFVGNARIKAKALAAVVPGKWVVADDSGLCCEGIGGLPGVHSARYAGPKARDTENVAKLLKMLQIRTTNRKAFFKCAIVAISPEGREYVFEGQLDGQIAKKQMGTKGFGYDPVFIPEGFEKSLAEMEPNEKNKISHRAKAMHQLIEHLKL